MKKLLFVAIAIAGLTLVSCNKDQSAVNKLDGSWTVTKMMVNDSLFGSLDFIALGGSANFTFNKCKLKDDSWCTGSQSFTFLGDTDTENNVYRVTGDGTVLEFKDSDTSSYTSTFAINELKKKSLKGTMTELGSSIEIEATKD